MLLSVIASSYDTSLFLTNFTQEGSLPLTSTFNTVANGFTEGYVYWGGGRDAATNNFYSFYSRTTTSSTWTYKNAKANIGQAQAGCYPVGSTSKWLKNGGEYGGAQNTVESMVYNGAWGAETNYPILIHYNGMGAIVNTKVGYSIAGSQPGSVYITSVYSYTGSGSWTAQTNYPINCTNIQIRTVSGASKVAVLGGYTSTYLSSVYSYTGSGSWVAEASLPASLNTNDLSAVYAPDTGKVYTLSQGTTDFYYWTGSGAWIFGGTRAALTTSGYAKNLAAVGTNLFALGGDYNGVYASAYRAVVK